MRLHTAWVLVAATGLLTACARSTDPGPDTKASDATSSVHTTVVAQLGNRKITSAESDSLIAPQLYQLDHERYLLRRQATEALLLKELAAPEEKLNSARIYLLPPLPPVVDTPGAAAGIRPEIAAPVTVTVFCDFESPHCASIQPTLADLLILYPGVVRIAARDLPLPFHPGAQLAAEAARCAGRQDRHWEFHDQVWARGRGVDRRELEFVATAIGLDMEAFHACVDGRAEQAAVAADVALARNLGLGAVPAVFVNGRVALAPVTTGHLIWLVHEALRTRPQSVPIQGTLSRTELPLILRATIAADAPGLALALISDSAGNTQEGHVVREGERVTAGALLRRVRADGVELHNAGHDEFLPLAVIDVPAPAAGPPAKPGVATVVRPSEGVMPVFLDRELVRERMTDRVELSTHLVPVPMTVDGYRLLRLQTVPDGSLYELLGLQPGDVIVAVNEQPIHEGDNPLWDALDRAEEVRVRVMRSGGLAQHYTYRFE